MCFMFGASQEQIRHALGPAEAGPGEAERDEPDEGTGYALHSSNVCAELPP
ncbi:hypothetical protein AB0A63_24455 [Lentzea sp. NPDC042327]|uniref:hypothetical protein n=1 Tax=Lentzea sp. NPDC042327 TaxID=3154801 RepID=UPI0033DAA700